MKYILSSSDDDIGVGSILIFDKTDVKSVEHTNEGFVLTHNNGKVYNGYDCISLGFEIKYVN